MTCNFSFFYSFIYIILSLVNLFFLSKVISMDMFWAPTVFRMVLHLFHTVASFFAEAFRSPASLWRQRFPLTSQPVTSALSAHQPTCDFSTLGTPASLWCQHSFSVHQPACDVIVPSPFTSQHGMSAFLLWSPANLWHQHSFSANQPACNVSTFRSPASLWRQRFSVHQPACDISTFRSPASLWHQRYFSAHQPACDISVPSPITSQPVKSAFIFSNHKPACVIAFFLIKLPASPWCQPFCIQSAASLWCQPFFYTITSQPMKSAFFYPITSQFVTLAFSYPITSQPVMSAFFYPVFLRHQPTFDYNVPFRSPACLWLQRSFLFTR